VRDFVLVVGFLLCVAGCESAPAVSPGVHDPPDAVAETVPVVARAPDSEPPETEPPDSELARPEAGAAPTAARVKLGIDVLLESRIELVAGKRVGLITNASAVDGQLKLTADRLIEDPRVNVVQLYAPEHGLAGAMRNGRSDQGGVYEHAGATVPVQGLTGDHFRPTKENLARHDVLVFDIQDIGSRTYTYISSLGLAMEAAHRTRMPVIVLDRPNPLGGQAFEGPVRLRKFKSFVGWGPLPVTHAMTMGEMAHFYRRELSLNCPVEVVQMEGWRRDMIWEDTGVPWVPTSPGIPHPHNAHLYVATGMVGGSGPNVNEGGGNSQPFELIGALFIDDPKKLADRLNAAGLPGVHFRPLVYRPWRRQFQGKRVGGVHLMLADARAFRPLHTALTILVTLQSMYGASMTVDAKRFRRIWGNEWVLKMIRAGAGVDEIEARWAGELADFKVRRAHALLYTP
jgi:uncharacterized protein YbbC (DUF1343 family)